MPLQTNLLACQSTAILNLLKCESEGWVFLCFWTYSIFHFLLCGGRIRTYTQIRAYMYTLVPIPDYSQQPFCHIRRRNEWRLSWQHVIKTWFSPMLGFLEWERGSIQPASLEAHGSTSKTQYPDQKCSPQTRGLTLFFFYFCSASFLHTGEDISFSTLSFKTTRCSG